MQLDMFPNEIAALKQKRLVSKSSPFSVLNPYIDEDGLIRIRGRLCRAYLPEVTKNLIVLRAHPLLVFIIQHHHLRMLHADCMRFSINARVIATRILNFPGPRYCSIRSL